MGNVVLQKCGSTTDMNAVDNFKRFVNGNQPFSISAKDLEGITEIPDRAFENCKYLTSIELPSSLTSIGDRAFYGCSNLREVISESNTFNNLQSVGIDAFTGCNSLQIGRPVYTFLGNSYQVSFPYQDGAIGKLVCVPTMYNGYIVSSVYADELRINGTTHWIFLPSTLPQIGARGVGALTHLEHITIPNNVTSIDVYAFGGDHDLASISFSKNVTSIGEGAFNQCWNLASINYGGTKAEWELISLGTNWDSQTGPYTIHCTDGDIRKDLLSYTLNQDGQSYSCTGIGSETSRDIVISARHNGLPVTGIGDSAFSGANTLLSVTIPDSVTSIGSNAFSYCTSLTSAIIPDSVTSIGYQAFCDCTGLTSVTVPDSVTSIGERAFYYCRALTSITYNGTIAQWGVISLGVNWDYRTGNYTIYCTDGTIAKDGTITYYPTEGLAYTLNQDGQSYSCSSIGTATDTDIVIATTYNSLPITKISNNAFDACSTITSCRIPDGVTDIGGEAFNGCSSLISIKYNSSVARWQNITFGTDWNNNTGNYTIYCTNGEITKSGTITYYPTKGLTYALNQDNQSYSCSRGSATDTDIVIPDTYEGLPVTGIRDYGFEAGTYNVTSVMLPNSITKISAYAFRNCTGLTSITLPDGITYLDNYAFQGCTNIGLITAKSDNAAQIARNCGSSSFSVVITSGTDIPNYAFQYCTGLTSITIANTITNIGQNAFSGCTGLTSIVIPDSVTTLGNGALRSCSGLTSVTLSNNLASLKANVLADCSSLTSVTIPNSVTYIHTGAFSSCIGLTSITIPSSVTNMGDSVFQYCTGLTSITLPNSIISIGIELFKECTNLTSVSLSSNLSTIPYGTFSYCSNLTLVTIPSGATSIDADAFLRCSSLTSITIPNGVTTIGATAFARTGLTSIIVPANVTAIGRQVFAYCGSLTSVTILNPALSIDSDVFDSCDALQYIECDANQASPILASSYAAQSLPLEINITSGTTLPIICDSTNKQRLTTITMPNTITSIASKALSGCSNLSSIIIPSGVLNIGSEAFRACSSITSIVIPSGVTVVDDDVLSSCANLTAISLPSGITTIGLHAFMYCGNLVNINYDNTMSAWGSITKGLLWDSNTGNYTIRCTDGDIPKQQ